MLLDDINTIEKEIQNITSLHQKLLFLEKLIEKSIFIDVKLASQLLDKQSDLLNGNDEFPIILLNYHLNAAFFENQMYHYNEAEWHYQQAFPILDESGDLRKQVETYIDYAGICINLERLEEAEDFLEKASVLLKTFPVKKLTARVLAREGVIHLHYFDFLSAHEFFLKAEKILSSIDAPLEMKDYYFLILVYNGFGSVYERLGEIEKSAAAFKKIVILSQNLGMKTRLSWHFLNAGNAFLAMNDVVNAKEYFKMAIDNTDDISGHARANAFANLGGIYFERKDFDKAMKLFEKAEKLYKENKKDDFLSFAIIENWKAKLFAERNDTHQTLKHFIRSCGFAIKSNDLRLLSEIYKNIASFYASIGEFESAYENQLHFEEVSKKYAEELSAEKMEELEVKYEAEKRKQEAKLLKLEAKKLQHKALRAQMNPHFIFNAINSLKLFILSNQKAEAEEYLTKISELIRKSLKFSDLEVISLEDEIEYLEEYLIINKVLRFDNKLNYNINVADDVDAYMMGVPSMIVQPYVENSIEHGIRPKGQGNIDISISLKDDYTVLITIEDDGVGRKAAEENKKKRAKYKKSTHRSLGTKITEERLSLLGKNLKNINPVRIIDLKDEKSGKPSGTRVEILIPFVDILK